MAVQLNCSGLIIYTYTAVFFNCDGIVIYTRVLLRLIIYTAVLLNCDEIFFMQQSCLTGRLITGHLHSSRA